MMNASEINQLAEVLHKQFYTLAVDMIIAMVIIILLKIIAEHIAGHIMFRMDKHTSIGSPIEVYGKKGRIKDVTLFNIMVETECGFIRIPTKHWKASRYILLKGDQVLRTRRATDNDE